MSGLRRRFDLESLHDRLRGSIWSLRKTLNTLARPYYDCDSNDLKNKNKWNLLLSSRLRILVRDCEASGSHSYTAIAGTLARKMSNVEPGSIMFLKTSPMTSLTNKAQVLAEEAVGSAIDWWPLAEPHRNPESFTCVAWSCRCGAQLSMNVPSRIANRLKDILATNTETIVQRGLTEPVLPLATRCQLWVLLLYYIWEHVSEGFGYQALRFWTIPIMCPPIAVGVVLSGIRWTELPVKSLGLSEAIATGLLEHLGTTFWIDLPNWVQISGLCPNLQSDRSPLRYSPTVVLLSSNNKTAFQAQQTLSSSNSQSGSTQSSGVPPGASPSNAPSSPASAPQSPPALHQTLPLNPVPPSPVDERHVFMGSKVGGHCLLSQWDTRHQNDVAFFKQLRQSYISTRGFWRYHFGFKVFSHCEFYRLKKLGSLTFTISNQELPECKSCGSAQQPCAGHQAYHYAPKPAARNPPVDSEEFYVHFYACHHQRAANTFRWHRCRHVPTSSNEAVRMIPRRETSLDITLDSSEVFWGLLVKEKYSILAIVVYNLLAMTPSLAFFFWWIFGSSEKDLSNGSVPATLTLGGLSLFWAIIVSMKWQES